MKMKSKKNTGGLEMVKNWICLECSRSGEKLTLPEAKVEHASALRTAANNNTLMRRRFAGFVGPSTVCNGNIVLKAVRPQPKPIQESGVLGTEGDLWL